MMQLDGSPDSGEVSQVCERWYSELDSQPLEFLLRMSKAPILETKLAVLQIYASLADHAWAQKVLWIYVSVIHW